MVSLSSLIVILSLQCLKYSFNNRYSAIMIARFFSKMVVVSFADSNTLHRKYPRVNKPNFNFDESILLSRLWKFYTERFFHALVFLLNFLALVIEITPRKRQIILKVDNEIVIIRINSYPLQKFQSILSNTFRGIANKWHIPWIHSEICDS